MIKPSKYSVLILIPVILWIAVSFFPCLENEFVNWDDQYHFYENELVRALTPENLKEMFRSRINGTYLPLTLLSYAVEYRFAGDQPFVYHLDNLILHLLVSALVFFLARRLRLSPAGSAAATLLFGIHPMHVESVAWVTGRKDVLYAFFYLLALHGYLSYLRLDKGQNDRRRRGLLALTTFLGIASLLAKPMAVSLPAILLLLDWWEGRRFERSLILEKVPLAVFMIAIGWLTYSVYARIPGEGGQQAVLLWSWSLVFYIRQFLFPVFFAPIYHIPDPVRVSHPEYALAMAALAGLAAALIVFRRRRWFVFGILYYLFSIFFLLRYDQFDINLVADRYMYLPSLGICLWFGWLLEQMLFLSQPPAGEGRRPSFLFVKGALAVSFLALGLVFSLRAGQQCKVWRNSISLWHHELAYFPDEEIALNNLANAYRQQFGPGYPKPLERYIVQLYEEANTVAPEYWPAYYNLACFYQDITAYPKAIEKFSRLLDFDPYDAETHFYLGEIHQELNDGQTAIRHYAKAVDLAPSQEYMYVLVISALNRAVNENKGKVYQEARTRFFEVYKEYASAPAKAADYLQTANFYNRERDPQRAVYYYQKALEADPDYSRAFFALREVSGLIGPASRYRY